MKFEFPGAAPEIPVNNIGEALGYYKDRLGFNIDWSDEELGLAGISRENCRMFVSDASFREAFGNVGPIVIWLNLDSNAEVDELYHSWSDAGAKMLSEPESKPWYLYEFSAADLDGNKFRVFYSFGPPENE
jgi:predicted lactoylglutathione lyase